MPTIIYESLTNGEQVPFTTAHVLQFNNPDLSPLQFHLRQELGLPLRTQVNIDSDVFGDIHLTGIEVWALTSDNFVFASGGFVFIGDNTPDTAFDDAGIALNGSEFDDYFLGGAGNDLFTGEDGNDSFELRPNALGKYGNDTYDGGLGSDWLVLFNSQLVSGVTVNLVLGTMTGGGPDSSLALISIENVDGSPQNDLLIGDDGDNVMGGAGGSDTVQSGGGDDLLFDDSGGTDHFDGGAGNDTLTFSDEGPGNVTASLASGTGVDDAGGGVTMTGIENLEAADGNDSLTGDGGDNRLSGGDGNDTLVGLGGDDRLLGGTGNDTLEGGAGTDILDGGAGQDTAVLNGLQSDIRLSLAPGGAVRADRKDGTDSDLLIGIETLRFSDNSTLALDPSAIGLGAVIEQTFPDDLDVRVGRIAATRLTDQSIVLTWEQSDGASTGTGIFAQRYDSNGQTTIGGTFRVHASAAGVQNRPGITELPDGGYLITWTSTNAADSAGDIFARRFSFDGTPLGAEQRINLVTAGNQYVARPNYIEETGQVGIGWTSGSPTGEYLTGHRYNLTATGISTTDTTEPPVAGFDLFRPNVSPDFASPGFRQFRDFADGSSVQGIQVSDFSGGNYVQSDALVRIFVPGGPAIAPVVLEDDAAIDSSGVALIQMQSGTTMFALWSEDAAGTDPVAFMARLDQGQTAFTGETQIGTDALYPSGQQLADGTILVVWTDGSGEGIVGRWLAADGTPLTAQFTVVASEAGRQLLSPQVVALEDGNALVLYNVRDASGPIPTPLFREFAEGYEAILLRPSDLAGHLPLIQGGDEADTLTDNSAGASELQGGAGNDSLNAGAGDDRIDGGTGADQMNGGVGSDIYVVDDAGDVLVELGGAGSGEDSVEVLISEFTLPDNVENLLFFTADDVTGTGNGGENAILSGAGDDALDGAGGDDILLAGSGNDSLTGGDGTDLIDGGGGTDTAIFDGSQSDFSAIRVILGNQASFTFTGATAKEMVMLTDSQGRTDRMLNVERVKFADGEASLTGNAAFAGLRVVKADQYIQDDEAASALTGTAKAEVLDGLDGDDTLRGGAGNDLLLGRAGADLLKGEAGNDVLDGGLDADTLEGGAGNDLYMIEVTPGPGQVDTIVETATGGTDTISTHLATFDLLGNSVIGAQNIEVLEFLGTGDFTGIGNERANLIRGGVGGDSLSGGLGADRLVGLGGNDTLDGGTGADRMEGGAGNDTYIVNVVGSADGVVPGDVVFEGSTVPTDTGGTDTVQSSVTYTLGLNVENLVLTDGMSLNINGTGNGGNNSLTGNAGNNVLTGGAGNDTFFAAANAGNDRFVGGTGNDTLNLSFLSFADKGKDEAGGFSVVRSDTNTITITEFATQQKFTITGPWGATTGTERGIESFVFGDQTVTTLQLYENTQSVFADLLTGDGGTNALFGLAGNDTLDGGGSDDTLTGGTGNDTYVVDSTGDSVIEAAGAAGGSDTIRTALAIYSLADAANVEKLVFIAVEGGFEGTGNTLANTITGGAGADTLDGGLGADRLEGGAGNDTYVVDKLATSVTNEDGTVTTIAGDVVFEGATALLDTGGTDTVRSSVTYTLGLNVENLVLIANALGVHANINGTGNTGNNSLTGNDGNNVLTGGLGDDTFFTSGGNDRFVGGTGNDTLNLSSLTFADKWRADGYAVQRPDAATVVVIDLVSGQKFTATGIESFVFSDQTVDLAALLVNSAGAAGEAIVGGASSDVIDGLGGNDTISGGVEVDRLIGGSGDDSLDGGAGADTLTGGAGNDTYVVDSLDDVIEEASGAGSDTVRTALATYTLAVNVDRLVFTGEGAFSGTGNGLANAITGGAGSDTLDGGAGADTLTGGAGNDTYIVGAGDVVVEADGGGTDLVQSSVSHTLAAFVDNLELTATGASLNISGTGNGLDNLLTGNDGNNSLSGGLGNDTLSGGLGNDTLNGGAGNDTVMLSGVQADYTFTSITGGVRVVGPENETDTLIGIESVRFGAADPIPLTDLVALVGLLRAPAPSHVVPALVYPEAEGARWNLGSPMGTPAAVTYSFMNTIPAYSAAAAHPGFQALTAAQQGAVHAILAQYSAVANITFNFDSGGGGQIRLGRDSQSDSLGYTYISPANQPLMGDVWLSVDASENLQLAAGQVGRYVLMHEIGHALGLDHADGLHAGEDSQLFTVMSYEDIDGSYFAQSPMLYDIAALQALYGPNMAHNAGNTTYAFAAGAPLHRAVWDAGGADVFDFSAFSTAVQIDLRPGAFSSAAETSVAIAFGAAIERAIGGSGNDQITGNSANNTLDGGAGSDVLTGGAGADTFVFSAALGAANVDTITDFTHGTDRIRLDDAIFTQSVFGEHILYDQATGALAYDADGLGGADAILFAMIGDIFHPSVTASDFQIV